MKAINDSKITDKWSDDTEQELKNYENMKSNIINQYKEQFKSINK